VWGHVVNGFIHVVTYALGFKCLTKPHMDVLESFHVRC
jgi:hypothetical protein